MLSEQEARDAIIVALDCDRETALELADKLSGKAVWVKVGMTLFYRYGPAIVDDMRARGLRVFLDLKLHDIPFQIRGAAYSASLTGADILSIHGLGGAAMISEGRAGVEEAAQERGGERTCLVAISVLTSMDADALASIGVTDEIEVEVARLAKLSVGAGSDGIVCSPQTTFSPLPLSHRIMSDPVSSTPWTVPLVPMGGACTSSMRTSSTRVPAG